MRLFLEGPYIEIMAASMILLGTFIIIMEAFYVFS